MTGTFTAGAVLAAADLNTALNTLTVNTQTGTSYSLVLTDAGKLVTLSNGSAVAVTVPLNSSVAFATGTTIALLNLGAGLVTVSGAGGVTLSGTTTLPQNYGGTLIKTGTDTWSMVSGGLPKASVSGTTGAPTVDSATRPGKTIYKYTGAGSITILSPGAVEVLVIGGGGGGGNRGGGGAGQHYESTTLYLPAGTHSIAVGAGGAAGASGGQSSVGTAVVVPGGGYGANASAVGGAGASGGGYDGTLGAGVGLTQFNGGTSSAGGYGGGGGGSSSAGGTSGAGGNGTSSSITGAATTRAGGGGGGSATTGGTGGTGGGGAGGSSGGAGTAGTVNTGSGGGGSTAAAPGAGGSGYVVVVTG